MHSFSKSTTGTALFALDSTLILAAWPFVLQVGRPDEGVLFALPGDAGGYIYPVFDLILLFAMGLYRRDAILEVARSFTRVPMVVGMGASLSARASLTLPLLIGHAKSFDRVNQTAVFAVATVCFTLCAWTARLALHALLRRHVLRRRLLIIGAGQRAWDLLLLIRREGTGRHDDVTLLHHPSLGEIDPRLLEQEREQIIRVENFNVAAVAREVNPDVVIVAPDERRGMEMHALLECKKSGYPVIPYLTFIEKEIHRIDLKRMELGWLVYSDGFTFGNMDRFLKRVFDVGGSAAALVLMAPLLLVAMIAIRLDGPGPVFQRQERVTQDGRVFLRIKLFVPRSKLGMFLRRTRVDGLPLLFNILRGDMSFVGPEPEHPALVAEFATQLPLYYERNMVKAGLTGWAQVNYPYGASGASLDDARSRLSYDLYYVKHFSVLFDFVILLQSLRDVLWPSGRRRQEYDIAKTMR
jgi:lipopolysaccharide/colanic/teichoic acid biosynthesis glycosyltransferase